MTSVAVLAGCGSTPFSPVTNTYDGTSGTETILTGASQVVITGWGGGGSGSNQSSTSSGSGNSGSTGSYTQFTLTLTSADWGKTLSYTGYAGGVAVASGVFSSGDPSGSNNMTLTSGTKTISPVTLPSGIGGVGNGNVPASGGVPTNANPGATNINGNNGQSFSSAGNGPTTNAPNASGITPGGGGFGHIGATGPSQAGGTGRWIFAYT